MRWISKDPVHFQQWKNKLLHNTLPDIRYLHYRSFINYFSLGLSTPINIDEVYGYAKHTLFPDLSRRSCVALFMNNLADVEWINVQCDKPLSSTVLCKHSEVEVASVPVQEIASRHINNRHCIVYNQSCLMMSWFDKIPKQHLPFHTDLTRVTQLQFLFNAVREMFPPILSPQEGTIWTFKRYSGIFHHNKGLSRAGGLLLYEVNPICFQQGVNVLRCSHNSFISVKFALNNKHLCGNISHKAHYFFSQNLRTEAQKIRTDNSSLSHLIGITIQQKKGFATRKTENEMFKCNNSHLIEKHLENDLLADCHPEGEDEMFLHMLAKGEEQMCADKGTIACRRGHPRCFHISEICKYQLTDAGHLTPCRTGEHMEYCKAFSCNMMFKCPAYYCVPWGYICDGKVDCPGGFDEVKGICMSQRSCSNMFKCAHCSVCIHLGDICDKKEDCPLQDDELHCELHHFVCPKICLCFPSSVHCKGSLNFPMFLKASIAFSLVSLQKSTLNFCEQLLEMASSVIHLEIRHSKLNTLSFLCKEIHLLDSVIGINVADNNISEFALFCLKYPSKLKVLILSRNTITKTNWQAFDMLTSLEMLDLSENPIAEVDIGLLLGIEKLKYLSLTKAISSVSLETYPPAVKNRVFLHVDDPSLCCLVSWPSICTAERAWYSKCRLLLNHVLHFMFCIVAITVFLVNIASFIIHFRTQKMQNRSFRLTISSINFTDMCFALNLSFLWAGDVHFGDMFGLHDKSWRKCHECFVILFIFNSHSIISPLLLAFLALQRLHVVVFPFEKQFKSFSLVIKAIVNMCVLCLLLALTITFSVRVVDGYSASGLCFPFVATLGPGVFTVGLTIFILCEDIATIVFSVTAYIKICFSIRDSHRRVKCSGKLHSSSSLNMILQFSLLIGTHILGWVVSGLLYIILLFDEEYPLSVPVWFLVCVSSANPMITPAIFIAVAKFSG